MTTTYKLYGDAPEDGESAGVFDGTAQRQALVGKSGANYRNSLFGDAYELNGVDGGNDVLIGGAGALFNVLYGDADTMECSLGGNDTLTGGAGATFNYFYGDAYDMSNSTGGNDMLIGGAGAYFNVLTGDGKSMSGSMGGNDVLIAGDDRNSVDYITANKLYGDAYEVVQTTTSIMCGNDRLVSGTGTDDMWGDFEEVRNSNGWLTALDTNLVTTGHDVFVFSANNGTDTIHDFRQGEDKIELRSVNSFAAVESKLSEIFVNNTLIGMKIDFGNNNTITILGVAELTADDFLFN